MSVTDWWSTEKILHEIVANISSQPTDAGSRIMIPWEVDISMFAGRMAKIRESSYTSIGSTP